MLQDYMCSSCGLEYPTDNNEPEQCPACKCIERVPVLMPATDGSLHGSWDELECSDIVLPE